jgi:release factor glutamine methyltransferase
MNDDATVAQALEQARGRGVAMLDARLMLGGLLGRSPTWLIAHDDERLGAATGRWAEWLGRRADGEPLAYLLGEKEFHGLLLEVTPEVLVPRPETELLVDWAIELLESLPPPAALIDLGTGSGAIALAVKRPVPAPRDGDRRQRLRPRRCPAQCARLALEVDFVEASWWRGLGPERRFRVAPPIRPIREGDPALAALRHEPHAALTPGGDGLAALREIVAGAQAHLDPGGWLLLEHGFDQAGEVRALLERAGLEALETRSDLAGHPRATGGRRPATAAS